MFRQLIRWPKRARPTSLGHAARTCASVESSPLPIPTPTTTTTNVRIGSLTDADVGRCVRVQGWIRQRRHMKSRTFVDLNDGSCSPNLQLLIDRGRTEITVQPGGGGDAASSPPPPLAFGASVSAEGLLSRAPSGQLELRTHSVRVLGDCPTASTSAFPFVAGQQHAAEYGREHLHLRARLAPTAATLRVRAQAARALADEMHRQRFCLVHAPVLTRNDCEGGGETFAVRPASDGLLRSMRRADVRPDEAYFDGPACLSVSAQLHLEALCHGLGSVYAFGPIFRAENSRTPVHLAEFYMLEAEQAFVERIDDLRSTIEQMLKRVTRSLLDDGTTAADLRLLGRTAKHPVDFAWLEQPMPVVSYAEAIRVLQADGLLRPTTERDGLSKEQELHLVRRCGGGGPLFVVEWPAPQKPFYMRRTSSATDGDGGARVDAVDLLVPHVGELCGGSLREDSYERLLGRLPEAAGLQWYADLRRFGGIRTGGFGMGFERYLQWLLGMPNIRDVIAFPRWAHNCAM